LFYFILLLFLKITNKVVLKFTIDRIIDNVVASRAIMKKATQDKKSKSKSQQAQQDVEQEIELEEVEKMVEQEMDNAKVVGFALKIFGINTKREVENRLAYLSQIDAKTLQEKGFYQATEEGRKMSSGKQVGR
jgi:hypothetical protein